MAGTPPGRDVARPVARVLVNSGLPHLDREFEYAVPAEFDEAARPGVRVKVRFAGRSVDGFVTERLAAAEHSGPLQPLGKVVSPEPVLTQAIRQLAQVLAARFAGTVGDIVRLAVPPRHARAERAAGPRLEQLSDASVLDGPPTPRSDEGRDVESQAADGDPAALAWERYRAGPAFVRRLHAGQRPAAAWLAIPSDDPVGDWPAAIAEAVAATVAAGRGALVVVPDQRDLDRLDAAVTDRLGQGRHVVLTAEIGPEARYARWLAILRGRVGVVIGTRAAAYAPVAELGLVVWWDDGDDLHAEPRAPYVHVHDVLTTRAHLEGAALLTGGFARSTWVARGVAEGSLKGISADRPTTRAAVPRVFVAVEGVAGDPVPGAARIPTTAWRLAKRALDDGPVLVQVPRRGYVPALRCGECRRPARCLECHGPVAAVGPNSPLVCRWCTRVAEPWRCPSCDATALRAGVIGARRTAEELGRAFPGVPVHTSGAGAVLACVSSQPSLVIATPGAEPLATGGYAAALLLDGWALLDRPSLLAAEEALRRWLAAAALVRPASRGGEVAVCGIPTHEPQAPVEALIRWDPAWHAGRELEDRIALGLPPAVWSAVVTGDRATLESLAAAQDWPAELALLGPHARPGRHPGTPGGPDDHRLLLRAPRRLGPALGPTLAAARAVRSARKEPHLPRIEVEPLDLD